MRFWKITALSVALLGAAGAGAAIAPPVSGQSGTRAVAPRPAQATRGFEVFSTRGGRIGVSVADVEPSKAAGAAGVLVESVEEDSPAEKAGLRKGDVVVEFDGERVRSVRQFTRLVNETPAGRQVPAAVMRDGQRVSLNLEPRESQARVFGDEAWRALENLGDYARTVPPLMARPTPPRPPAAPRPPATPRAPRPPAFEGFFWSSGNQLGVSVNGLSDQLKEYFGVKDGVLVTSVTEDSAAAKAGVKAGDVIVSVNGSTVDDPSTLRERMQRLDAGVDFTLEVMRDKKPVTLKGKVEEARSRRSTTRVIL